MIYVKSYKKFNEGLNIISDSFDISEDDILDVIEDFEHVDNDEEIEEFREVILKFIRRDFNPNLKFRISGLGNFPDRITLYRVLTIGDGEELKDDFLGYHWTPFKEVIDDHFLASIDFTYDENEDVKIIEAIFDKNQIDLVPTIISRYSHILECEITIKANQKPISYNITNYFK